MNEKNNSQKHQATKEQEPSDEIKPEIRLTERERQALRETNELFRHREISEEELKQILEDHVNWLDSDGKEGEQADLSKANLYKANLSGAILDEAILSDANLRESELSGAWLRNAILSGAELERAILIGAKLNNSKLNYANLKGATLEGSHLAGANLVKANLQGANLNTADMRDAFLNYARGIKEATFQNANLQGVTGLLGNEFAQADVTGTKLPDDIKEFKALEIVKETSQNARKIFFAMLLGCVYSWLTIATTTDVRLLTNTASSPLPIIGTEIPIAWFYIAAPLVLICLYFYFNFYLQGLWEGLASLPAIFPDGKRLDERAYPWLLNGLVRKHFKRLKKDRPFMAHLQDWVTIFLAWWVVPLTMIWFWLRFLPHHQWIGTSLQIGLIVISVAFAIIFYRLFALTLQGKQKAGIRLQEFWRGRRFYYPAMVAVLVVFVSLLSYWAINGDRTEKIDFTNLKNLVPLAFKKVGYDVFVDFREKDVSEKPAKYWETSDKNQLRSIKGANLKNRNLKNADMYRAFLVKADLRFANLQSALLSYADLQYANLEVADLQKADLKGANLQQANFRSAKLQKAYLGSAKLQEAKLGEANLQKANLLGAELQEADLGSAKLQKAYLRSANLQKANLWGANLQEANLGEANLQEANLRSANLTKADLGSANLQGANLWGANLQGANLWVANLKQADLWNANLQQADLGNANLQGAKLWGAKLQKADLWSANLQQADLGNANLQEANLLGAELQNTYFWGADLSTAKYLKIDQLSQVKTLYQAKLDPELMEQVKKCCPHLLEKPKEETDKKEKTE